MDYPVSAGAMLYAVMLRGHSGIHGMKNVPSPLQKDRWAVGFQTMEMELMESGLGMMDFDGNFSLEPRFAALVDDCARCADVLAVASRRNGETTTLTCYLCADGVRGLEETAPRKYLLHERIDPAAQIPAFLNLREDACALEPAIVDSFLIQRRDVSGLMEAGCSEALARLVANAAKGTDGYTQLFRITGDTRADVLTLLHNEDGTVCVDVEYTWERELFRLTPVTVPQAADRIRQLLEG